MEDLKNKSTLLLAHRLNEIMKEQQQKELDLLMLDNEFNAIVYELWDRIPKLRNDEDLQPKKRVRGKCDNLGCNRVEKCDRR